MRQRAVSRTDIEATLHQPDMTLPADEGNLKRRGNPMDLTRFTIEFDDEVNALYVTIEPGTVAKTIVVAPSVNVDVDASGTILGYEFVNADRFLPFLREHHGELPPIESWTQPQRMAV